MKHLSQQDIARQLGVAVSTVSRALNDQPGVGEALRDKIKALAKENDYRPNPFAMGLRYDAPHIIGVIVPDIATHFFSSILKSVEKSAQEHGYFSVIMTSNECLADERRAIHNLLSLHVEGIIICLSQETVNDDHLRLFEEKRIPVVFYDRVCRSRRFSTVTTDDSVSAREATSYMIACGARRVAFLGGANHVSVVANRKHGYLQAIKECGMKVEPRLVACHEMEYNTGLIDTLALLDLSQPPDAILAMNDTLAFAAMEAIKSRHLRIPHDIQLIGYTDEAHAKFVEPRLTSVRHNTSLMGRRAFELLYKQITGDFSPHHVVVDTHLEIRQSTK